jgi:purine-binding chemotaxis protein CheW
MMSGLYLIASVTGKQIAIDSQYVESVVRIGEIVPVPKADAIVAGLFALRSRVLTLIDCQYRVTGQPTADNERGLAVIASVGANQFGFIVEKVLDVVSADDATLSPLPPSAGKWAEFSIGHADIDGRPVVIVDLEKLVSREPLARAA